MISTMYNVLQISVANDRSGLTAYILNNYRKIDKSKVQFGFVTYDGAWDFTEEVGKTGGKVFDLPHPFHPRAYYKGLKKIREEAGYDAIHLNLSYANIVPVLLAKLVGFQRIIVHSHSSSIDSPSRTVRTLKKIFHYTGRELIPFLATDYYACSHLAARWMFPGSIMKKKKYEVLYNAIDLSKFRFSEEKRKAMRESLGIEEDTFVVGHVGRFSYQKNHEFLIQVFQEITKREPKAILLLVGDGPDREKIESQVKANGLEEKVKFLGRRSDVAELYQAMDALVMPSRFEGLCIVAIEAQMAALPNFCSEALSDETFVSSDSHKLSLSKSPAAWADEVLQAKGAKRGDRTEILRRAGYDAEIEIKRVEKLYTGEM